MTNKLFKDLTRKDYYFFIFVFVFSVITYGYIILYTSNDISAHSGILSDAIKLHSFPFPPGYFAILYLFSFFSTKILILNITSIFILAAATLFKFNIIRSLLPKNNLFKFPQLNNFIAFSLIIIFPIYLYGNIYLGKIPPNVWHNSTTIFVMPFSVLLFIYSFKFLKSSGKYFWVVFLLGVINILIKPNYIPPFMMAFFIFLLIGFEKEKIFKGILLLILIGVFLVLQLALLYYGDKIGLKLYGYSTSSFSIDPFSSWSIYTNNYFLEILLSGAFPILFVLFYFYKKKVDFITYYSILTYIFALIVFIMLKQDGEYEFCLNFMWTPIITNCILFVVTSRNFLKILKSGFHKINLYDWILIVIFTLHLLSGILYLIFVVLQKY